MLIRILLLVETSSLRSRLSSSLTELGVLVLDESEANKLWSRLGEDSFDLVVATRSMLPTDVERAIEEIRALPYRPEVIVLADLAEAEERAALQKGGAFAVIDKTMPLETLIQTLRTVLLRYQELGVSRLRESRQQRSKLDDFSSESPAMRRLLELARRVSDSDTSLSKSKTRSFVPLTCRYLCFPRRAASWKPLPVRQKSIGCGSPLFAPDRKGTKSTESREPGCCVTPVA